MYLAKYTKAFEQGQNMQKETYNPENDEWARVRAMGREPKPERQRARMSEAKRGVPKSDAHKQAMRETQKRLGQQFKKIIQETGLTYREAKKEYTRRKNLRIEQLMQETGQSRRWCTQYVKTNGID